MDLSMDLDRALTRDGGTVSIIKEYVFEQYVDSAQRIFQ
jgi:hypothetical protein